MPYEFYKVLHLVGLLFLFTSLSGYIFYRMAAPHDEKRKFFAILHGLALLVILVSGFGLAARLGFIQQLPNWIYTKLVAWFLAGAAFTVVKRQAFKPMGQYAFIIAIGVLGIVAVVVK